MFRKHFNPIKFIMNMNASWKETVKINFIIMISITQRKKMYIGQDNWCLDTCFYKQCIIQLSKEPKIIIIWKFIVYHLNNNRAHRIMYTWLFVLLFFSLLLHNTDNTFGCGIQFKLTVLTVYRQNNHTTHNRHCYHSKWNASNFITFSSNPHIIIQSFLYYFIF